MNRDRAQMIARDLMGHFGLASWSFKFDGAARRFGVCRLRIHEIGLSGPLTDLNEEPEVIDTILHEIAHALAGRGAGHGPRWKATALEVGAKPERCYKAENVTEPPAPFTGKCPKCAREVFKHRRRVIACRHCCQAFNGGKFSPDYAFQWRRSDGASI